MTRLMTAIISSATSTKSKKPHSGNQTTMTVSATTITPTSSATESVFEAPSPKINLMIAVATRFTPTLETTTPTAIQLQSIPQLTITTESNQFQEGQVADSATSLLSSALNFSSTPTTTSNPIPFWLPYVAAEAATGCKSLESQDTISIRNASVSAAAPHSWKYHARQSRVSSSGLICSGHLKLPSSTSHVTTLSLISVDE
ncbi:hypothetical protein BDR26DRAFT_867293 [Obelidium mucronatum]|nr:hypothetical protein BDR26DRAFT_867293 [Obelidium mucronatum]